VVYLGAVDTGTIVGLVIAALSLALSIFVWLRQRTSEGRAHFTADWEGDDAVVYLNHGPGAAKDVRVVVDTKIRKVDQTIPYVGAFQQMRVGDLIRVWGEEPLQEISLQWNDNRRQRQSVVIHLQDPPKSPPSQARPKDELEKAVRRVAREEAADEMKRQASSAARNLRRF